MSKYQVRLGEKVTDKIVNCGAGVYWYIDKLQSEIERLNKEVGILRHNSQYLVKQKDELEEIINEALKFTKENENNISSIKDLENNKTYNSALLRVKYILQRVDKE